MPTGVYSRKRKKEIQKAVKGMIRRKTNSRKRMTLIITAKNDNGYFELNTFKIRSYGEIIDIIYNSHLTIQRIEVNV